MESVKKFLEKSINNWTKDNLEKLNLFGTENILFGFDRNDKKLIKEFGNVKMVIYFTKNNKKFTFSADIYEIILQHIKSLPSFSQYFTRVNLKYPFINFFISDKFVIGQMKEINNDFGRGKELKNKKVILEYTNPNPFKEFHIGHLMSNTIGESLSRIFEFQGAKVRRVCYQGDVGIHIAKAIWGIIKGQPTKLLGTAYEYGSKMYEENENAKKEIVALNKKIYQRSDKEINKIYDEGKKLSLEHFDEIYKKLGTKFNYFIFESQVSNLGKKIVEKGLKNGIFEKSEGAVVLKGEKYGFHTRVFVNSEGLPTYEAKDLGLAEMKYKKYAYDKSFVVTGNEVNEYFKVVLCAMAQTNYNLSKKTKHIGHGMLRLPEGKMSSRTGKVVTLEFLLNEVEKKISEKMRNRYVSSSLAKTSEGKEKEKIVEKVAIGALKYSILKQSIRSDIVYDFDKSISFEGDSGPYLQYSYTRARSVLRKAKAVKIKPSFKNPPLKITSLEEMMYYFPDVVEKASKYYEPHFVSLYLIELAGEFNSYYVKNKIVDKTDEFSPYKIAMTKAFSIIMKNGLWLLGIETLEKM